MKIGDKFTSVSITIVAILAVMSGIINMFVGFIFSLFVVANVFYPLDSSKIEPWISVIFFLYGLLGLTMFTGGFAIFDLKKERCIHDQTPSNTKSVCTNTKK